MNRRIACLLGGACLLLLPGCGGWLQSVPKDTVMIRTLPADRQVEEPDYDGVLSQEAVKTLSLEAVKRYYGEQLSMDELRFELSAIDSNTLRDLLADPREVAESGRHKLDMEQAIEDWPSGLYYVTLSQHDPASRTLSFELVLGAADGNVLRVDRSERLQAAPVPLDRIDVFEIAEQYIREKADASLNEVRVQADMVRWGTETTLFYTDNDNTELKYSVTVNLVTSQVTGFSKDVMALLRYHAID